MRKLATIRVIDDIQPIADADAIECATVGGWKVVVKKGEYKPGDTAIYLEIDSWVPHQLAPFLSKGREPLEYEGIAGERLRTVRLRGQLSQGLLLPTSVLPSDLGSLGDDVSDILNIRKYDPPIPGHWSEEMRGPFPAFLHKTDQERIQNLAKELETWVAEGFSWELTEKLDGSSMTVYVNGEDEGVCSRNINLRQSDGNTFWQVAIRDDLIPKLKRLCNALCGNFALQGELVGPGIQGNPYKLTRHSFYLFDVYSIDDGKFLSVEERNSAAHFLDLVQVPLLCQGALPPASCTLDRATIGSILGFADGESLLAKGVAKEGVVCKSADGQRSFKAISNDWLMKEK